MGKCGLPSAKHRKEWLLLVMVILRASLLSLIGENSLVSPTPTYLAFSDETQRDIFQCTVSLSEMRSSCFFCWALWAWQFGVTLLLGSFPPLVINGVGCSCSLADVVSVLLVEKW